MTCIIGVEHNGTVYMGADSIGINGWSRDIIAQSKMFKRDGMLFGCSGSPRMAQILQHHMVIAKRQVEGQSNEAFIVQSVIEPARLAFREYGYTEIENGQEQGASFLLGYRGQVYTVGNQFQLGRSARNMCAMGAGEDFAMGALWAILERYAEWDGEIIVKAIRHALATTAELCSAVAGPFVVETLEAKEASAKVVIERISNPPLRILAAHSPGHINL